MDRAFHFYFDLGSPASYLAFNRVRRNPLLLNDVVWHPMLLGAVLKLVGNQPPIEVPCKRAWMEADFTMFAQIYDIPFRWNTHLPLNTLGVMRLVTAVRDTPEFFALLDVLWPALWKDDVDVSDPDVLRSLIVKASLSPNSLLEKSTSTDVKERLKAETSAAVDRGVFGAPTFLTYNRLFFGQDRLEFAETYWRTNGQSYRRSRPMSVE